MSLLALKLAGLLSILFAALVSLRFFAFAYGDEESPGHARVPIPPPEEIAKLPPDGGPRYNRLVFEKSPYLLQHAGNPVDWFPWGDEAFEKAKKEGKPVFLSIGYSTCHWCHVMERESFEDEEVAVLLNREFVAIKVDREEREDVDGVYMEVCLALTGRGGWPLTIVMAPDRRPFYAATYLPKRGGLQGPGLMDVLEGLSRRWKSDRASLLESADGIVRHVTPERAALESGETPALPGKDLLARAAADLAGFYDPEFGGFGRSPKFPAPHNYSFLLSWWHRSGDESARSMATKSLEAMRLGGIFDQVGLGFHRYSTDREWLTPHFEKMLYDQATMTIASVEAFLATGDAFHANVAREVIEYVFRVLRSPDGAFYSAEDADSEGEEGRFYLFTKKELVEILGPDDGGFVASLFGATEEGNYFEERGSGRTGKNILHLETRIDDDGKTVARWASARKKLFEAREKRVHPHLDDKILTSWNGLMISALARAAQALNDDAFAAAGAKAAEFVWTRLRRASDGRLLRRWREGEAAFLGHIDDYAYTIQACLDLYEATFEPVWLERAIVLERDMTRLFADAGAGGYFFDGADGEKLLVRRKEVYDGAIPSGNSVALLTLLRLERMTGERGYGKRAEASLAAFASTVAAGPSAYAQFLVGLDFAVGPTREIVIAGKTPGDDGARAMIRAVRERYLPRKVVLFRPDGEDGALISKLAPYTADQASRGGRATAYVCSNFACLLPTTDVLELKKSLETR